MSEDPKCSVCGRLVETSGNHILDVRRCMAADRTECRAVAQARRATLLGVATVERDQLLKLFGAVGQGGSSAHAEIDPMTTTFGKLLRAERCRRGLTLRELSVLANVDHSYIYRLEAGEKTQPSDDLMEELIRALKPSQEVAHAMRAQLAGVDAAQVRRATLLEVAAMMRAEAIGIDARPRIRRNDYSDGRVAALDAWSDKLAEMAGEG